MYFVAALALLGTFLLPWLLLDGFEEVRSGIEILTLLATPWANYLYSISAPQTWVLIGAPVALLAASIQLINKYSKHKQTPCAAALALAAVLVLMFGASELIASPVRLYLGLRLALVLTLFLTVHQLALLVQGWLWREKKAPRVYRALSAFCGREAWRPKV